MNISLVSPVYNDQDKIGIFIDAVYGVLKSCNLFFEIIIVDDCSADGTDKILKEYKKKYKELKVIRLNQNSGQHIATSIGLKNAEGNYIFMIDSDLQIDAKYIKEFLNYGEKILNWDIISAKREGRSKGFVRNLGSHFVSWILKLITRSKLNDIGSTFKLIKRSALDKLLENDILIQNLPILMMNLKLKIVEYSVQYDCQGTRESHYKFTTLFYALVLALLNFSSGSSTLITLILFGCSITAISGFVVAGIIIKGMIYQTLLPTNYLVFFLFLILIGLVFIFMGIIVFKVERINKNLGFRKYFDQRIDSID